MSRVSMSRSRSRSRSKSMSMSMSTSRVNLNEDTEGDPEPFLHLLNISGSCFGPGTTGGAANLGQGSFLGHYWEDSKMVDN